MRVYEYNNFSRQLEILPTVLSAVCGGGIDVEIVNIWLTDMEISPIERAVYDFSSPNANHCLCVYMDIADNNVVFRIGIDGVPISIEYINNLPSYEELYNILLEHFNA